MPNLRPINGTSGLSNLESRLLKTLVNTRNFQRLPHANYCYEQESFNMLSALAIWQAR